MRITPTSEQPLLIGLLVDVSGSMTSSIRNAAGPDQNRLQSFQSALGELASKATELSDDEAGDRAQIFAYGFGFGNLLGALFSRAASDPVRDLLEGAVSGSSTVGIGQLASNWLTYKAHVEDLAIKMFGATPMLDGVETVAGRFREDTHRLSPCAKILFLLSDGEPTDATPDQVTQAARELFDEATTIVSCYVTDRDITESRHLYGAAQEGWPEGARLMFDLASPVPAGTQFAHYLGEKHWLLDEDARLFTQINQSEVLAEFLQVIISPLTESRPTVFVSYSHQDTRWRDRLEIHLKPLVREGAVDLWDDTRISAGSDWRSEISAALRLATVAVLLVSADFLASDFIAKEELPVLLDAAQGSGLKILPVVVEPARFAESPLGRYQAVNSPSKPLSGMSRKNAEDVLVTVSREIERDVG